MHPKMQEFEVLKQNLQLRHDPLPRAPVSFPVLAGMVNSSCETLLTLHKVRASSAHELQPRRRQISKTARAILGALEETYIMSAIKEKLSTLALDT